MQHDNFLTKGQTYVTLGDMVTRHYHYPPLITSCPTATTLHV